MDRRFLYSAMAILCLLSCYLFYSNMRLKEQIVDAMLTMELSAATRESGQEAERAVEEATVTFYICGEVAKPDVYTLPKGSRIVDAIEAAGGKTNAACIEMMASVAGEVSDGQKIYVPNSEDDIDKISYMNENSRDTHDTEYTPKNPDIIVNINTADVDELCQIPGIGPQTAKMIHDYRLENGGFTMIEDIKNVQRIGDKTFENIKNNITVD